jgi:uncharacterized membrane protein
MAGLNEFGGLKEKGMDRILALSDGVFAFAVTLMVLDLAVPAYEANLNPDSLGILLAAEWPAFFNYILSFFIVSIWWNGHHRNFEYIDKYDGTLKALNLVLLLFITLVPYFTKLHSQWFYSSIANALYAADMTAAATCLALIWWYASRKRRLLVEGVHVMTIKRLRMASLVPPVLFTLSIPLAFINVWLPMVAWFATIPAAMIVRRRYRK